MSVNKLEVVWGTTRLLPPKDEIPEEFYKGNVYTQLADAMWCGEPKPNGEVTINPGFEEVPFTNIQACIMAHLKSFDPQHEHKIAGVGFMISKMTTITRILT